MEILDDYTGVDDGFDLESIVSDTLRENQQEANEFLQLLWGNWDVKAAFILWAKGETDGAYLYDPSDSQKISYDVCRNGIETDIYFGVGLQNGDLKYGGRGKAQDVVAIPGLWMDVDLKRVSSPEDDQVPSLDDALGLIKSLPWGPPSIIVESGNGFHVYWLFKTPWYFYSEDDRKKAMDLSRRFQTHIQRLGRQQGWNWDYTGDLSRILRIPGTLNHKDKSNLKPVRLYETSDHRYDPAELEGFLPADRHEPEPPRHTEGITYHDLPQADLSPILDDCLFMAHFRDDAAKLKEPEWVAGLTIVARCTDAVENAHKLSKPYAGYSYEDTEAKLLHAKNKMGPRTCSLIHDELAPNLCETLC